LITILTVDYNSHDFVKLMVESVRRFDTEETPIVVVDNSKEPDFVRGTIRIENQGEKSHGEGLNLGLKYVDTEYVLILDADCHVLSGDWKQDFRVGMGQWDVLTVAGPVQKPLRPACVFLNADLARSFEWRATEGYKGHRVTPSGFDVGIRAYHAMMQKKLRIGFMDAMRPNRYKTLNGEEYLIGGIPTIYHHWHGTHLNERSSDFPGLDLQADKDQLFKAIRWRQKRRLV
jgi:hypothetical protein